MTRPMITMTQEQLDAAVAVAIAAAVQAEREAIRDAAQPFIKLAQAIPTRRGDDMILYSAQAVDASGVIDVTISVGDVRKLAAAIRARGNGGK